MISLIKKKINKCKCSICGSVFKYEPTDIIEYKNEQESINGLMFSRNKYKIKCPACGFEIRVYEK